MEESLLRDWEGMTKEQIMHCLLRKRDAQDFHTDETPLDWKVCPSEEEPEADASEPLKKMQTKVEVQKCIGCHEETGKYKCPSCHLLYCRIACFQLHKKNGCSKTKVPQAFKAMKHYTERDLMRDFGFISNIMEGYDKVKKRLGIIDTSLSKHQEMVRYKILAEHAHNERSVIIKWAPRFMERHRENISFYFTKEKKIYWVVEILAPLFVCGDSLLQTSLEIGPQIKKWTSLPVSEDSTFRDVLEEFPFADNDALVFFGKDLRVVKDWSEEKIELYIKNTYRTDDAVDLTKLHPSISQAIEAKSERIKISLDLKLSEVIACMTLDEFPTLYLVKND